MNEPLQTRDITEMLRALRAPRPVQTREIEPGMHVVTDARFQAWGGWEPRRTRRWWRVLGRYVLLALGGA